MKKAKAKLTPSPASASVLPTPESAIRNQGNSSAIEVTIGQIIAGKAAGDDLPPLLTAWRKLKIQAYPGVVAYRIQRVWRELHQAWTDYEEVRCSTVKRLGEPHPEFGHWIPDNNIDALRELQVILRDYAKNVVPLSLTGRLPFPTRGDFTPMEIEQLDTLGLIEPPEGFVAPTPAQAEFNPQ